MISAAPQNWSCVRSQFRKVQSARCEPRFRQFKISPRAHRSLGSHCRGCWRNKGAQKRSIARRASRSNKVMPSQTRSQTEWLCPPRSATRQIESAAILHHWQRTLWHAQAGEVSRVAAHEAFPSELALAMIRRWPLSWWPFVIVTGLYLLGSAKSGGSIFLAF